MNQKYTILIARSWEPLDWLDFLPSSRNYKVIVSNSGEPFAHKNADLVIDVENLGREAGHYLNFCANNLDFVDDICVFLQGDPWPHLKPKVMLELLFGNPEFKYEMSFLGTNAPVGPPEVPRWTEAEHILLAGWKGRYWKTTINHGLPWVIGQGAQFYIKKDVIKRRPARHYVDIRETARDPDSKLAHVLEFQWPNVFDLQY